MSRRALLVVIPNPGGPGDDGYPSLEKFSGYADDLASQLSRFDYETNKPTETANWNGAQINKEVRCLLDEGDVDDVRVVHIFGHGEHHLRTVYPIGADAERDPDCDVEAWLKRLQPSDREKPSRPVTLFIVDTCHSGQAARTSWGMEVPAEELRGWVLAASAPERSAYDGRLTLAVARQLRATVEGALDISPDRQFIPWATFRDAVIEDVEREQAGGLVQRVTSTPVDRTVDVPFFPNPAYQEPGPLQLAKSQAATGLGPFLDPFTDVLFDAPHFIGRARGPEELGPTPTFTGRRQQLADLSHWIDHPDPLDALRIVTGSPGVGKSALLGVLVCAAHPDLRDLTREIWSRAAFRPLVQVRMAGVHARSQTLSQILTSIGQQLTQPISDHEWTTQTLIDGLSKLDHAPLIALDALDEAENIQGTLELLRELTLARRPDKAPACRLLIGTRSGEHWSAIQAWINEQTREQLVDLDAVTSDVLYEDLVTYLASVLHPNRYAVEIARGIADTLTRDRASSQGWGEFLVAALYALRLRRDCPDSEDTVAAAITRTPRTLPEVLEVHLADVTDGPLRRAVLTALSWSKGVGMPRRLLQRLTREVFTSAVHDGHGQTDEDFTQALDGVSFYLRTSNDSNGELLRRPFHQGLTDYLRPKDDPEALATSGAVLTALLADRPILHGQLRWDTAVPYLLRHALDHAIDARQVDRLLDDEDFIAHADPDEFRAGLDRLDRLSTHDHGNERASQRPIAAVYRQSFHQHRAVTPRARNDILRVDWARFGLIGPTGANRFGTIIHPSWDVPFATGSGVSDQLRAVLTGHTGWVRAVACATLPDGSVVAVTGSSDGTVRVWDLTRGQQLGQPLTGHTGWVRAVACATLPDGSVVAVTGSRDRTVRVWDLTGGELVGEPLTGHTRGVSAVACATLPDGSVVAVTGSDDRTVRVWDLTGGQQLGQPLTGHTAWVSAVACATLPDGSVVAVTGSDDRTVRVWDLTGGQQLGEPLTGHIGWVSAVACATLPDGSVVAVTGSRDGAVRVWDLTGGQQLGEPLTGHTGWVSAVACATLPDGSVVAVTGSRDGAVRVWDLTGGQQLGEPLTGHTGWVRAVACATLPDGSVVAVTGSDDGAVRVWDLTGGQQLGEPLTGHIDWVSAVACATLPDGSVVAVTGSDDRTVRVWDLTGGQQLGEPLTGHIDWVSAVACATLPDGSVVAVTGSRDGAVRVWDLTGGEQVGEPLTGHTGWVRAVACATLPDGSVVAVTGSVDRTVRVWDLTGGQQLGEPLTGHTGWVRAVACATLPDGSVVAVTGSVDRTVRVWDLTRGQLVGEPLTGHTGWVSAVACATLPDGSVVAVTGSSDRTVRVWDLTRGEQVGEPLTGHTGWVSAVACATLPDGSVVAVTASSDRTVRVWDLTRGEQVGQPLRFDLPESPTALSITATGQIVVCMGFEIVVLQPGERHNLGEAMPQVPRSAVLG